ncbi:HEAT repeat domain-containing protein [Roseateles chitinivorans]|uniref:HEAT repeat domain-containing protein n=1 Tax=Roseateles chitinivorans TaxID=2917965 RepID=UPI003D67CA1E
MLPLVRRHSEDAAFYWQQLAGSAGATELPARRARHFAELLTLHLEGLGLAGAQGRDVSLESLQRWRKPGEAFAALHAALAVAPGAEQTRAVQRVFATVTRAPDSLLRGAISALAWADPTHVEPWLTLSFRDDVVRRVASLRAMALRGLVVSDWKQQAGHESAFVRAAACRAAPVEATSVLLALRTDVDLAVRAESVLAWARLVPSSARSADDSAQAASVLWCCVSEQLQLLGAATGWHRMQAQRRLTRWLRHLAWLAPLGHPGVPQLLNQLPPRLALSFVLHHGDPRQLGFVLQALQRPDTARWALWVWRSLTGVDPQEAGLTLPDAPLDLDAPLSAAQQDSDHGLPLPDPAAVVAHPASRVALSIDQRCLMGQPVQAHVLRALLDPSANHSQALRFVAGHALEQVLPAYALNLRASPAVQAAQLARMGIPQ